MNLEHDLREALKRKNPPQGFDASVLKRIANGETPSTPDTPDRWRHAVLPVAASLLFVVGVGLYVDHRSEIRSQQAAAYEAAQAQEAAHNVAVALLIASEKVSAAQARVLEVTHHESQTKN